jgi:hypothetical protein
MNQTIDLGPTERRLYEAARIEALESLAKSAAAGTGDEAKQHIRILAALTRLRLLCCHPRLVVKDSLAGSAKLAALVELLTERKPLTGGVIAARPRMREIGVDGIDPAKARRAWTSRQGNPRGHEFARGAAIGLGSQPSWRG